MKTIVSVGDVVEVATSKGLAHAQWYGDLVRILPGFYEKRPVDLQRLIDRKEALMVFFQSHADRQNRSFQNFGALSRT